MVDNSAMMKKMYEYTAFQIATKILGKFYLLFFLPHCFMPFALLKHAVYLPGNKIIRYGWVQIRMYKFLHYKALPLIHNVYNVFAIYITVLWSTRAMVFVFFGTWPLWKIPIKMLLKPVKPKKEEPITTAEKPIQEKKEN